MGCIMIYIMIIVVIRNIIIEYYVGNIDQEMDMSNVELTIQQVLWTQRCWQNVDQNISE